MNIEKAKTLRGWMSHEELTWLADQASKHSVIVEIGSYCGRSTRALAENTPGFVIAVDDFQGADTERPLSPQQSRDLYLEFRSNLQDLIDNEKVTVCHPDDIAELDRISPDFCFIDGDHSYGGITKDINYWLPRVKAGGLLCGHDSGHLPIKQALSEIIPNVSFAPQTSIWFFKKN